MGKLNFMRWVHRQRMRRDRIQEHIRLRRRQVEHLHGRCKKEGLKYGAAEVSRYTLNTLPPHPDKWVRFSKHTDPDYSLSSADALMSRFGVNGASTMGVSMALLAAVLATAVMLF